VVAHIGAVAQDDHSADYVELAGLPKLRKAFADELGEAYRGAVQADNVVVTAGCNQAFCLAVSALAGAGDEVVLALPYYFNHNMWLRMNGIRPRYLEPGPDLVPTPAACEALLNDRVRAIVLVTPGNPSGVVLAPEVIADFAQLARRHGIALILDETYRTFRGSEEPAHRLFSARDWAGSVISLHSFAKDLALPGHRVGAVVGSPELNRHIMKLLDCVAICAPRVGQEAAWAGLTKAADWRARRAAEVAVKKGLFEAAMADRPGGFELLSCGGFFGWVRHPFAERATDDVVRDLAQGHDTLVIPGTAFRPDDRGTFRVSFSNVDEAGIAELALRLTAAGTGHGAGRADASLSR
jgi:aspartate/methionine/tyrosine aminotransferase